MCGLRFKATVWFASGCAQRETVFQGRCALGTRFRASASHLTEREGTQAGPQARRRVRLPSPGPADRWHHGDSCRVCSRSGLPARAAPARGPGARRPGQQVAELLGRQGRARAGAVLRASSLCRVSRRGTQPFPPQPRRSQGSPHGSHSAFRSFPV